MDIPRTDSWSLHCLVILVRESNVTRAGAVLGLSQPATSAILARLRVMFQDPLLVKSATAMVPTPRALELASRADRVLEELRSMVRTQHALDPATLDLEVSVVAMDLVRVLVMPRLLSLLQTEAPGVVFRFQEADRTRIHERFEHAEIDLGIGPEVVSSGRLHFRALWTDEAVCMAREDHPALSAPLTLEAFAALDHVRVVPSRPSFYDDAVDKALQAQGLRRDVQATERSYLMVPRLLEASRSIAVVPRRFAQDACERHPLKTFAPPVPLPPLCMGMYWHERTHTDPAFQWLRQRIMSVMHGAPEGPHRA